MDGTIQQLASRDALLHSLETSNLKLVYRLAQLPSTDSIGSLTLSHRPVCLSAQLTLACTAIHTISVAFQHVLALNLGIIVLNAASLFVLASQVIGLILLISSASTIVLQAILPPTILIDNAFSPAKLIIALAIETLVSVLIFVLKTIGRIIQHICVLMFALFLQIYMRIMFLVAVSTIAHISMTHQLLI